jgi:hypothetical protein
MTGWHTGRATLHNLFLTSTLGVSETWLPSYGEGDQGLEAKIIEDRKFMMTR